jgi:hypothetical protein
MFPTLTRYPVVLALLLAGTSLPAAAAHLEVQGGRSYMDTHGTRAAFVEATFAAHPIGTGSLDWSPDLSVGWIDGRHIDRYASAAFPAGPAVTLLAAGARFHYGAPDAWYRPLFVSLQLAGINHTTQSLSSHYQFVSSFGWQGEHVSLQIRHISNGGLNGPNRGETMALVGVGFDF